MRIPFLVPSFNDLVALHNTTLRYVVTMYRYRMERKGDLEERKYPPIVCAMRLLILSFLLAKPLKINCVPSYVPPPMLT